MKIPALAQKKVKDQLWCVADERNWPTLSDRDKSALYAEWIRDEEVGGVLSRFLDPNSVRVYIKDTIMKPYGRERIKEFAPVLNLLGLQQDATVAEAYVKPHGRRLTDGRVICWGMSRDWKAILFAVFERAYIVPSAVPLAAVIMFSTGKCQQPQYRQMIERAAEGLGIECVVWDDS